MIDRIPYMVTSDPALSLCHSFIDKKKAIYDIWKAFAKKHGAEKMWGSQSLYGLIFPDEAPKDWYHKRGDPFHVFIPRVKSPAFKEMKDLPLMLSAFDLCTLFEYDPGLDNPKDGMAFLNMKMVGESLYLSIPAYYLKQKPVPVGLVEVYMSEYLGDAHV